MIKVGCMGFGGGNALIPVIEEEAVKDKKLVSCQEYDRTILAATLTPGLCRWNWQRGSATHPVERKQW